MHTKRLGMAAAFALALGACATSGNARTASTDGRAGDARTNGAVAVKQEPTSYVDDDANGPKGGGADDRRAAEMAASTRPSAGGGTQSPHPLPTDRANGADPAYAVDAQARAGERVEQPGLQGRDTLPRGDRRDDATAVSTAGTTASGPVRAVDGPGAAATNGAASATATPPSATVAATPPSATVSATPPSASVSTTSPGASVSTSGTGAGARATSSTWRSDDAAGVRATEKPTASDRNTDRDAEASAHHGGAVAMPGAAASTSSAAGAASDDASRRHQLLFGASERYDVRGKLGAVSSDKGEITIYRDNLPPALLKVESGTRIQMNGHQASLAELRPGDDVRASFNLSGRRPIALEVNAGK